MEENKNITFFSGAPTGARNNLKYLNVIDIQKIIAHETFPNSEQGFAHVGQHQTDLKEQRTSRYFSTCCINFTCADSSVKWFWKFSDNSGTIYSTQSSTQSIYRINIKNSITTTQ